MAFARTIEHTTPVSQATARPDPELTRLRQADEGGTSPTAGGWRKESSPTASCYHLRSTQTRTYWWERAAGPGVRLATSPAKGTATETRSGRKRSSHIKAKSLTNAPQENDDAGLTKRVDTKTGCPLCTASFTLSNSMRTHLRRQHSNYRMVRTSKQTGTHNSEVNSTGTEDVRGGAATLRPRRSMVTNRLLSARQTARLGTWNVRSLRGLGKTQQLAVEMERHKNFSPGSDRDTHTRQWRDGLG